jgi:hypothetical protein
MPRICYVNKNFNDEKMSIIRIANEIIAEYQASGFSLTLRQLYYQYVQRDKFPKAWADPATGSTNNPKSYIKLGDIISDGRLAGLIDWDAIEDRTRNLQYLAHWASPADIVDSVSKQFRVNLWDGQPKYVEVWVEKDALIGVLEAVCNRWDVPYFSCRGYTSQSEMWGAAQRLREKAEAGRETYIIHLGDHDPSGKDMTRDVFDRLQLFMTHHGVDEAKVNRIALNMNQIEQYNPPPNPAKITDTRAGKYIAEFGDESWELDALEPRVIAALIERTIRSYIADKKKFEARQAEVRAGRSLLAKASKKWDRVVELIDDEEDEEEEEEEEDDDEEDDEEGD